MSLSTNSGIIGWLLVVIFDVSFGVCPYTNSDYYGSDINPRLSSWDWKGCAYKCETTSGCVGWVFDSITNYCYPKNGWSVSGITSKSGVYTGPKSCSSGCEYKFFYTSWTTSSDPQCGANDTPGPRESRTVNNGQVTQYRRLCRKTVDYIWTSWKTGSKPACPSGYIEESQQKRWKWSAFDYEYRRKCYKLVSCNGNANFFDFNYYDDDEYEYKYNWNLWDIVIVSIITSSMVVCLYHLMCKLYKIYCHHANNGEYKHVKMIYDTDTDIEMVENKPINE